MPRRTALIVAVVVLIGVGLSAAYWILFASTPTPPCGGSGCPPNRGALAIGAPRESTSQGSHLYNFSIESAGGGIGWINLAVTIVDASGTSIVPSGAGWNVTAFGIVGGPVAYFQLSSLTHTWTTPETAAVTSQESLLVTAPPATPLGGQGDSLVVEGLGSFSGSISIAIP